MNAVVLASNGNDGLDRFMRTLRAEAGLGIIPAQDGIWHAAEALRRNEVLALLIDGPTEGKSVPVGFLGGSVRFSAGPAALALRTKAVVLPACTVRLPDSTFKGFIGEKVEPGTSGDFHGIVQTFTQRMLDSLQGYVRRYPDQWGLLRGIVKE
jgi:KDO2-lipid IV(A) lauroyltransferase